VASFVTLMLVVSAAVSSLIASRSLMHYFQLESYQFAGYFRTLKRNWLRALTPGAVMTVYLSALFLIHRSLDRFVDEGSFLRAVLALVVLALSCVGGWWVRSLCMVKKAKKPLVVTMRVKRTAIVGLIVYALVCWGLSALLPKTYMCCVFPLLLPLWMALAGLCAWPVEKLVSEMYFRDAQRILASRPDLIKIGITGSYGKTSVKFILGTLLAEK